MNPRDSLHPPTVANAQTITINPLHLSHIGMTKLSNGDACIAIDDTWHARVPDQFSFKLLRGESVQSAFSVASIEVDTGVMNSSSASE